MTNMRSAVKWLFLKAGLISAIKKKNLSVIILSFFFCPLCACVFLVLKGQFKKLQFSSN